MDSKLYKFTRLEIVKHKAVKEKAMITRSEKRKSRQFTAEFFVVFVTAICFLIVLAESSFSGSAFGFSLATAGDWGCGPDATSTLTNILDKKPDLVLAIGDYSYETTARCWLDLVKPISGTMHIGIGNHDVISQTLLYQYLKGFNLENPYYSFNYQNIHILIIDTNTSLTQGSAQYNFIKTDLENAAKDSSINWIIPVYHIPAYTTSSEEQQEQDNTPTEVGIILPDTTIRDIYHPLFDRYGVDIVIQAHVHNYQRTYPISYNNNDPSNPTITSTNPNDYKDPKGPIFVIVGTAGKSHAMFEGTKPSYIASQQDTDYGFLSLQVSDDGTTLTGTFYPNGGGSPLDQFTISK